VLFRSVNLHQEINEEGDMLIDTIINHESENPENILNSTEEIKKRVSICVIIYFKDKKAERFKNIKNIDDDIEKYIKPLNRNNEQYGWYVYIEKCKADFGGVHIPLEKSKEDAIEFIKYLKNHLAKHLVAGSPLEPI
jgi:hypothetical protein